MHGYLSGSVCPTTELVLSHKHPDDYRQIADTLEEIRRTRRAFTSRHRIRDVQHRVHHVVVGDQLHDDSGNVIGTHGFYLDVTPSEQERQQRMTTAVAEIAENRAAIGLRQSAADRSRPHRLRRSVIALVEPAWFTTSWIWFHRRW
jgi:hypothetical protein